MFETEFIAAMGIELQYENWVWRTLKSQKNVTYWVIIAS